MNMGELVSVLVKIGETALRAVCERVREFGVDHQVFLAARPFAVKIFSNVLNINI